MTAISSSFRFGWVSSFFTFSMRTRCNSLPGEAADVFEKRLMQPAARHRGHPGQVVNADGLSKGVSQ